MFKIKREKWKTRNTLVLFIVLKETGCYLSLLSVPLYLNDVYIHFTWFDCLNWTVIDNSNCNSSLKFKFSVNSTFTFTRIWNFICTKQFTPIRWTLTEVLVKALSFKQEVKCFQFSWQLYAQNICFFSIYLTQSKL